MARNDIALKSYDLITEADARTLPRGQPVRLAPRGHITPLALDTLRERRIPILRDGAVTAAEADLAPAAEVRTVAIASDHAGVVLRRDVAAFLRGQGRAVLDLGGGDEGPVDYPDVAAPVARAVARGEAQAGIVIDGAGIGSAIVANKIAGIRAAMAASPEVARYSREHAGANVLTLGATLVGAEDARAIVAAWLATPMREPRYIRRLSKIRDLERSERGEP